MPKARSSSATSAASRTATKAPSDSTSKRNIPAGCQMIQNRIIQRKAGGWTLTGNRRKVFRWKRPRRNERSERDGLQSPTTSPTIITSGSSFAIDARGSSRRKAPSAFTSTRNMQNQQLKLVRRSRNVAASFAEENSAPQKSSTNIGNRSTARKVCSARNA